MRCKCQNLFARPPKIRKPACADALSSPNWHAKTSLQGHELNLKSGKSTQLYYRTEKVCCVSTACIQNQITYCKFGDAKFQQTERQLGVEGAPPGAFAPTFNFSQVEVQRKNPWLCLPIDVVGCVCFVSSPPPLGLLRHEKLQLQHSLNTYFGETVRA